MPTTLSFFRVAALALGVVTSPVFGQSPAAASLDILSPGTDTLYNYLVRGDDTLFVGTVIDALQFQTLGGRRVVHRVYVGDSRLSGPSRDSMLDDAETMRPLRSASYSARGIERVEYGSDRARGLLRQSTGDSVLIDVALPPQVHSSASFDLVLRASPLANGWSATVPAFVPSSRVVVPMTARVIRQENVDGWQCWRVDSEFMGMPVTFWVEVKSRKLCRQEMHPQLGTVLLFTRRAPGVIRRGTV